jgi:Asp-tRNA(Asn)/Glu-tRNA(Gln) amidotransferase A subunit family amidase
VSQTIVDAVSALERAGATIRRLRLPIDLPTVAAAQQTIMQVEAAEAHARLHAQFPNDYSPRVRALVETGALIPAGLYLRAQRIRSWFRQAMAPLFADVDCLAMPTASNVAPPSDTTGDRTFQAPWSLIGVPALTIPAGLADGLPVGLQLVANAWQEARLLRVSAWVETILGPLPTPPGARG